MGEFSMRRISLDELQAGMYLSRPLIAADGKVLLHEGIEMKERYIQFLRQQGFTSLYIGEPEDEAAAEEEEDYYDLAHRKEAVSAAREAVDHFRVGKGIQLDRVKNIVSEMISQLDANPEKMLHLLDIRRKEEYIFSHAVNTCILSVMTGLALGYDAAQLDELGLAAMLHDVGKIKFSQRLASQFPDYLSRKEREEYKQHPIYTQEILRENRHLPVDVVNACFQHHERWNGSGYPQGLKGDAISEYAQIISIADVYDRLIAGMPHRRATPVYYAVAILNKAAGEYFSPAVVEKFNQNVAIYPIGKTVRLNNHQVGVILGVGIKNKSTPVIRITSSPNQNDINQLVELDLKKNPEHFIVDFEEINTSYTQAYADQVHVVRSKEQYL